MRILVVSSSRADWGLLAPVVAELRARPGFDVHLALTGQHLMQGSDSLDAVKSEGVIIDHLVPMGLSADDRPAALAQAMGKAVAGVGELIGDIAPDLLMVLGDRYEILSAVTAAVVARVPVAHLCGGDVTEGAIDDSIRHAITKLSSLHFVTNVEAERRVRQLGEPEDRVFTVGSPGIDRMVATVPLSRTDLLRGVGLDPDRPFLLVTLHPATLAADPLDESRALVSALEEFSGHALLLTGSNADPGARAIDAIMQAFAADRGNAAFERSLGSQRYFSALRHAAAVVGNSSSGLYEAPSFKVPTVNIGDRQKGRLRARSVIDCEPSKDAIVAAISRALDLDCADVINPYGDGRTSVRIADILETIDEPTSLARKTFVNLQP